MSCFKKKLLMYHFQICFLNPRMNNFSKNIFFHLKIKVKGMLIIVKLTVKRKKKELSNDIKASKHIELLRTV